MESRDGLDPVPANVVTRSEILASESGAAAIKALDLKAHPATA